MLEKPQIDIQIDGIYQSRYAEQESSLKSYAEQLPSLLISLGPMTEIRDLICIWELLKDQRRSFVLFRILYLANSKKYEEILRVQSRINLPERLFTNGNVSF